MSSISRGQQYAQNILREIRAHDGLGDDTAQHDKRWLIGEMRRQAARADLPEALRERAAAVATGLDNEPSDIGA